MKLTKKQLDQELKDFDGEVFFEANQRVDEQGRVSIKRIELTLRTAITRALTIIPQGEKLEGDEKEKRGWLAQKIHEAKGEVELSGENIERIRASALGYFQNNYLLVSLISIIDPEREHKG